MKPDDHDEFMRLGRDLEIWRARQADLRQQLTDVNHLVMTTERQMSAIFRKEYGSLGAKAPAHPAVKL